MSTKSNDLVVDALSTLLASSYALYLKAQNYHWNVTGPMFTTLHDLFEEQYTELATAIDEIAERIRTLGSYAPGSFSAFAELSTVREETGNPDAMEMVRILVADHEAVVAAARQVIEAAEASGDHATEDLAVGRLGVHDKNAWILRSHLG